MVISVGPIGASEIQCFSIDDQGNEKEEQILGWRVYEYFNAENKYITLLILKNRVKEVLEIFNKNSMKIEKPKTSLKKILLYGGFLVILGFIITFFVLMAGVKYKGNKMGGNAAEIFHKDKVEWNIEEKMDMS
jgi:hypothetical protein